MINHQSDLNQHKIDTKIDWASLIYHNQAEDLERVAFEIDRMTGQIMNKWGLNFKRVSPNFYRDSEKSIALVRGKRFLRIEFEGSHFKLGVNNFANLKARLQYLNSLIDDDQTWSITRIDVAKTIKGVTVEEVVPSQRRYVYDFNFRKVTHQNKEGVVESQKFITSKSEIVFYRKDLELKSIDRELLKKKSTELHYMDCPHTRAEMRFKSGSLTLKIATELLLNRHMDDEEFCNHLLSHGTKDRNVKVRSLTDSKKSRWKVESRWAAIFKNGDKNLKPSEKTLSMITTPPPAQKRTHFERQIRSFENFVEQNNLKQIEVDQYIDLIAEGLRAVSVARGSRFVTPVFEEVDERALVMPSYQDNEGGKDPANLRIIWPEILKIKTEESGDIRIPQKLELKAPDVQLNLMI